MARERMIQARDLIAAKRYKEARSILKTIDHPTAREWLAKIDQIEASHDLGDPFASAAPPPPQVIVVQQALPKKKHTNPLACLGCLVVIGLCGFSVLAAPSVIIPSIGSTSASHSGTLTPSEVALAAAKAGTSSEDVQVLSAGGNSAQIQIKLNDLSADFAKLQASVDFPKIACNLRQAGFINQIKIVGVISLVDSYGKTSTGTGVSVSLSRLTIANLNCSNPSGITIENIADEYYIHPALTK